MASDSVYRIARFYIRAAESSCRESLVRVVRDFVEATGSVLVKYELNYGAERPFEFAALERSVSSLTDGDFESLSVMERKGAKGFHVGSRFRPLGISEVYEYLFAYRSAADFAAEFAHLAATVGSVGTLLTGYGRNLTENFEPATEAQMKRTWLGGVSIKGVDPVAEWLEHPQGILEGATKGIYGLNLISARRAKPPDWLSEEAVRRAVKVDDNAYLAQLSPTDLRKLRERKELKPFVREDAC